MVLVEDANAIITQGTALVLGIVSLVGLTIKFLQSRTHNPRLVALETKAEKYDQEIGDLTQQVSDQKTKILTGVGVAGNVIPQLNQVDAEHAKQIKELQQTIAALQDKVNQISAVVPKS